MQVVLAVILSALLIAIGVVHLYWMLGGRKGMSIALPSHGDGSGKPLFKPGRFEIGAVIVLFWAAALLVLMYADVIPAIGPPRLPRLAAWALVIVFAIRAIGEFHYLGLFKRYRTSPFGRLDTYVYSPLCLVMSGLTWWMIGVS
ncbi:DUF3995 domain-containing protein [Paenibacillus harenae]|uniref:DUF3995 domain-containing protein n=1 Tax=Paenibacillus harenae TaxID=306543 RepID=A0ABT9TZR3_PAEHA|nr:DUF3995 domain-containing protein [Paenibacillus harenae]MDQ0112880.1 hypothetical protein [Paenibacillus harenae]